jgi:hypothetical protein
MFTTFQTLVDCVAKNLNYEHCKSVLTGEITPYLIGEFLGIQVDAPDFVAIAYEDNEENPKAFTVHVNVSSTNEEYTWTFSMVDGMDSIMFDTREILGIIHNENQFRERLSTLLQISGEL